MMPPWEMVSPYSRCTRRAICRPGSRSTLAMCPRAAISRGPKRHGPPRALRTPPRDQHMLGHLRLLRRGKIDHLHPPVGPATAERCPTAWTLRGGMHHPCIHPAAPLAAMVVLPGPALAWLPAPPVLG